jgi:hypothetical protein
MYLPFPFLGCPKGVAIVWIGYAQDVSREESESGRRKSFCVTVIAVNYRGPKENVLHGVTRFLYEQVAYRYYEYQSCMLTDDGCLTCLYSYVLAYKRKH